MLNRSTLMRDAWAHYRRVQIPGRAFDRALFGQVLAFIWKGARVRLQADREAAARRAAAPIVVPVVDQPMTEMEVRIDGLKYLSARYRIDIMEREIRAEYAFG